jgi:hypothetical protein
MAKRAKRSIVGDLKVLVFGALALLTGRGFLNLANMDHAHELDSNQQLRASTTERQEKHRHDAQLSVANDISMLRRHILVSTLWLATAVFVAIGTESIAKGIADSKYIGVWSVLAFGVATLGRLGWSGQSFSGDSTVERLDRGIFWLLYWLGTLTATWAVIL